MYQMCFHSMLSMLTLIKGTSHPVGHLLTSIYGVLITELLHSELQDQANLLESNSEYQEVMLILILLSMLLLKVDSKESNKEPCLLNSSLDVAMILKMSLKHLDPQMLLYRSSEIVKMQKIYLERISETITIIYSVLKAICTIRLSLIGNTKDISTNADLPIFIY